MPVPIVVLASWLLPGAGYWLIGQRSRGLTIGITILTLFLLGLLVGGMRVVEPASGYFSPDFFRAVGQKPWFVGQILAGPVALVAAAIGRGEGFVTTHARINEIGTLYTAVAGMLNLLAIIDAAHRAAYPQAQGAGFDVKKQQQGGGQ